MLLMRVDEKADTSSLFKLPPRITKPSHFRYVFQSGRMAENGSVKVYFSKAQEATRKVAFVAGKKVGNAVIRNICKRRLRELFRLHQYEIKSDIDIVMVAKSNLARTLFKKAETDLMKLLPHV